MSEGFLPAEVNDPQFLSQLCAHVSRGGAVGWQTLLSQFQVLEKVLLTPKNNVEQLNAESCVVFGPVRGHAADLAAALQRKVLDVVPQPSVVFLGNMIDGGCQSIETISLVLALKTCFVSRAVVLRGAHEFLFPISVDCTGPYVGRLEAEILARSAAGAQPPMPELLLSKVSDWFSSLPVAVVVNDKFFCVSSGIAHRAVQSVAEMNALGEADGLVDMLVNDPMDEDDEETVSGDVAFASNLEREVGHSFTYNASCNFLVSNKYWCIIRGNPFTTQRSSSASNSCGRPWHYQYSPNDSGYRLFQKCPTTGVPTVISLFSAPGFCSVNRNLGAVARVDNSTIRLEQFGTNAYRPMQLPGPTQNAFHWSMPIMCSGLASALSHMLFGAWDAVEEKEAEFTEARGRRLLKLLKGNAAKDQPLRQLFSDQTQ